MRLLIFFFAILMASANQLEKSSTTIIDIGGMIGAQPMEVPAEWVWYDGPAKQAPWATVLERRIESTESCITDNLSRENCPIDAVACEGSQQIDIGTIAANKTGRAIIHSQCGQIQLLDGSWAQLKYNPDSGFCERVVTTSYGRLDLVKTEVGRQPGWDKPLTTSYGCGDCAWQDESNQCTSYVDTCYSTQGSFTSFSFTIDKPTRFGPTFYKAGSGSGWSVALDLKIKKGGVDYLNWQIAKGSSTSGSVRDPLIWLPGINYIVLQPGTYSVTNGTASISSTFGYMNPTMADRGENKWGTFMLQPVPCADGGELGNPFNPSPKTDVNTCYKEVLRQEPPGCPSGYTETTPDPNCTNGAPHNAYHCTKDPSFGSGNTVGPLECKKDYTWNLYGCNNDANTYAYPWEGPALTQYDCKGDCGPDGCTCEDLRPENNCWRGMFTCPIDPDQLCTKGVFGGECPEGESVEQIEYRPLDVYSFTGEHRKSEFGRTGGYHCGDQCGMNLQWIEGRGQKLCVGNALGESTCFDAPGCSFTGRIDAGFDGKAGRYLSGFGVNADLRTIAKAARTWRECDDLLNCTLRTEPIDGAIAGTCDILGAVGNRVRLGGMTAAVADGPKITFWDSYQDGEIGMLEIVPAIPPADLAEGFGYQNDKAAALALEGFSAIYEVDGKTWVLSGSEIGASECAAAEAHGFYRESANAKASIRVPEPYRINQPSGNSWCLLARPGSYAFWPQKLSIRTIVHEACEGSVGNVYDATPVCAKGTLNAAVSECVETVISTYAAKMDCNPTIAGIWLDSQNKVCKEPKTTTTAATASCETGTLENGVCKGTETETADATPICDKDLSGLDSFVSQSTFAYKAASDKCEGNVTTEYPVTCDTANGYAYDTTSKECRKTETLTTPSSFCATGQTYNATTNLCVQTRSACGSGRTYNSSNGKCEKTYTPTLNFCSGIAQTSSKNSMSWDCVGSNSWLGFGFWDAGKFNTATLGRSLSTGSSGISIELCSWYKYGYATQADRGVHCVNGGEELLLDINDGNVEDNMIAYRITASHPNGTVDVDFCNWYKVGTAPHHDRGTDCVGNGEWLKLNINDDPVSDNWLAYKMKMTVNESVTPSCPDATWTRSGGTCTKTTAPSCPVATPQWTADFTNNDRCVRTLSQTPTCEEGDTIVGHNCRNTSSYQYTPTFTCDVIDFDGESYYPAQAGETWTLNAADRICSHSYTTESTPTYSCSSGDSNGTGGCLSYSTISHAVIYSCADPAQIPESGLCSAQTSVIHPADYTCPSGGEINGVKCLRESAAVTHFCSPHSCNDAHLCRVADCAQGYTGTILTADLNATYAGACTDQRCDAWEPYALYCGMEHGCPPGAANTDDGCFTMDCKEGEFDILTGRCRQWGCPEYSAPKDGKCWK